MDDIEYFFMTEDNFDELVAFINEDFLQREPLTAGTHAEKGQAGKGRVAEDIRHCLRSGISVGARDSKTGQLVGFRGAMLVDPNNISKPTQPANEFEELYRIMDLAMSQVFVLEKAEKFLMMYMLSVRKEYCRRGIASRMVTKCIEAGIARGAELACTVISNVLSGKVFLKLGFEKRYTLEYKDDCALDKSRMSGNDKGIYLMTKKLSRETT